MTPLSIQKLAAKLATLPSVGPRQALRLAFHISSLPRKDIQELGFAVNELANIRRCAVCYFANENNDELCNICVNASRDKKTIAIVEKDTDLISLEKANTFQGRYLVIGRLSKDGTLSPEAKKRLDSLEEPEEVILALSPTTYGDVNAESIKSYLKDSTKKITRLGKGIPFGAEVEFADEETLLNSLLNRK